MRPAEPGGAVFLVEYGGCLVGEDVAMSEAYICDAVRTPFGRYGGQLSGMRADDLAAVPIRALMDRNTAVDWSRLDDVIYGNVNQAGEDNRNVARMAALLAGLPVEVTGVTVNRLCGSGLEAVLQAGRLAKLGEAHLVVAGGVESMSRAPFVMAKASWQRPKRGFRAMRRFMIRSSAGASSTRACGSFMVSTRCRKRLRTWLRNGA